MKEICTRGDKRNAFVTRFVRGTRLPHTFKPLTFSSHWRRECILYFFFSFFICNHFKRENVHGLKGGLVRSLVRSFSFSSFSLHFVFIVFVLFFSRFFLVSSSLCLSKFLFFSSSKSAFFLHPRG